MSSPRPQLPSSRFHIFTLIVAFNLTGQLRDPPLSSGRMTSTLAIDRSAAAQLNLTNLRRSDAEIVDILGTPTFVSVYARKGDAWERKEVEGTLFVAERWACRRILPPHAVLL